MDSWFIQCIFLKKSHLSFQAGNPQIWPICIPKNSVVDNDYLKFRSAQVVGYGPDKDDNRTVLTFLDLTINSINVCNERYTVQKSDSYYYSIIDELPQKFNGGSVFCASHYGSHDGTCKGNALKYLLAGCQEKNGPLTIMFLTFHFTLHFLNYSAISK